MTVGSGLKRGRVKLPNDHTRTRAKTTDFKRDVRLILGAGGLAPAVPGRHYRETQPKLVKMNKHMLDLDALRDKSIIRLKYISTRNKAVPDVRVSPEAAKLMEDIALRERLHKPTMEHLSEHDRNAVVRACNVCHVDIGYDAKQEFLEQLRILRASELAKHGSAADTIRKHVYEALDNRVITQARANQLLRAL